MLAACEVQKSLRHFGFQRNNSNVSINALECLYVHVELMPAHSGSGFQW